MVNKINEEKINEHINGVADTSQPHKLRGSINT